MAKIGFPKISRSMLDRFPAWPFESGTPDAALPPERPTRRCPERGPRGGGLQPAMADAMVVGFLWLDIGVSPGPGRPWRS